MATWEIYFRIEKIDLDGFPASPKAKIGASVSYGGKVYCPVQLVRARDIDTLNLNWTFQYQPELDQILTVTVYKSRIFKKSSTIGGLVIDLSSFRPDMICHRCYTMEPVDGISGPRITCTLHMDEQGSGRFNGVDEPCQVSQAMVDEELRRAEEKLQEEIRQQRGEN